MRGVKMCVCLKSFSSNAPLLILDCARMRIEFHNKVTKNLGHANIDLIYVNLFNYFMKHICTNTAISWCYSRFRMFRFVSKVSVYHMCGGFSMFRKNLKRCNNTPCTHATHTHTQTQPTFIHPFAASLPRSRSTNSRKTDCNFANESNNKQFEVEWTFAQMLKTNFEQPAFAEVKSSHIR